jgi:hypothetical protein
LLPWSQAAENSRCLLFLFCEIKTGWFVWVFGRVFFQICFSTGSIVAPWRCWQGMKARAREQKLKHVREAKKKPGPCPFIHSCLEHQTFEPDLGRERSHFGVIIKSKFSKVPLPCSCHWVAHEMLAKVHVCQGTFWGDERYKGSLPHYTPYN